MRGRHGEGEVQEELDGGHDDGRVAVQQAVVQDVHYVEHLLLAGRAVAGHRLQHLALRPLREVLRGARCFRETSKSPSCLRGAHGGGDLSCHTTSLPSSPVIVPQLVSSCLVVLVEAE